jgi:flagellar basal body-associated protein FliL
VKKTIIIVIIAVAVAAAGLTTYFLFFRNRATEGAEPAPEPTAELYTYAIEDYFVTNIKDSYSLFKTSIVLAINQAGMDEFLTSNQYIIRDTIIFILRGLTEEDILNPDIQDRLRAEIPEELNKALDTDCIVSVYFNDFVMQ